MYGAAICILCAWVIRINHVYMHLHIAFNLFIHLLIHPHLYGYDKNGYFIIYHYQRYWYILTLKSYKKCTYMQWFPFICNKSSSNIFSLIYLIITVFFYTFSVYYFLFFNSHYTSLLFLQWLKNKWIVLQRFMTYVGNTHIWLTVIDRSTLTGVFSRCLFNWIFIENPFSIPYNIYPKMC